jgi:hypothetical protein
MESWKRAVVFGALGVGAVLLLTGKRGIGMAAAAAGLAVLASEYPEKFEELWEDAPEYLDRGIKIFNSMSRVAEHLAEEGARRGQGAWREITAQ